MGFAHGATETVLAAGRQDEVDMIGYQAVGPDLDLSLVGGLRRGRRESSTKNSNAVRSGK
jgi:hypothetical protein